MATEPPPRPKLPMLRLLMAPENVHGPALSDPEMVPDAATVRLDVDTLLAIKLWFVSSPPHPVCRQASSWQYLCIPMLGR